MKSTSTPLPNDAEAAKAKRAADAKAKRAAAKIAEQQKSLAIVTKERADKGVVLPPGLAMTESGFIHPTYDNCRQILGMSADDWGMGYDTRAQDYVFENEPWPKHYGNNVNDDLVRAVRDWMVETFGTEFKKFDIEDALKALCFTRHFDPVVSYLDGLAWDGKARIESWLPTYWRAEANDYTRAVGRLWLVGAVARAMVPGIKFDTLPIFEGPQGTEKSGALEVLGGRWYSSGELGDLADRDAVIATEDVWIQELGELGSLKRSNVKDAKAFFSRREDKYRPIHGKKSIRRPRNFVLAATDNPEAGVGYLLDPTGNRRLWPVECGAVDADQLAIDRDQLWAEAVHIWREISKGLSGRELAKTLVLPKHLWSVAGIEQQKRVVIEEWAESVKAWLDDPYAEREESYILPDGRRYGDVLTPYLEEIKEVEGQRYRVSKMHSRVIFALCLNLPDGIRTNEHGRKLRSAMRAIGGWEFHDNLTAGKLKGVSGYVRVAAPTGATS